ncbi:cupin domain-containing protein [Dyella choica]|uniref:Cupin domain-containing protein n=1 Tax=Dyella choica TaxID=1927959 RepID=A0A3S0RMF6_9GAMM|nr:cupin domain-containing protein [Dyella choica]RUL78330.1 cupin domain-containing protein [Dyella choica]
MTIATSALEDIIEQLGLQPHPEGGFYRQTYRCDEHVTRTDHTRRHASTGIYYLLHGQAYSAWHRIDSDEMWHFYAGDPLLIHMLDERGEWKVQRLGDMLHEPGAVFQFVVPAGCWFAAEREGMQGYSLMGCTVAPGFEFATFELADTPALLSRYPRHEPLIRRLAPRGKSS